MPLTSDVVHADADRASAARKLPQTAANFFVGTNSRVPRLALAQSNHVIPLPATPSPGLKSSSHVAHNRLRGSPFPSTPTSVKALCSPREPRKGGKVAKAVHLFSNFQDEASSSSEEQSEVLPVPTYIDDEAADSNFSDMLSVSTNTDVFATSAATSPSEVPPPLPPKDTGPHPHQLHNLLKPPSGLDSASTMPDSSQQDVHIPSSLSASNPAATADNQVAVMTAEEMHTVHASPNTSSHDSVDAGAFTLSSTISSSHDGPQARVGGENGSLASEPIHNPSSKSPSLSPLHSHDTPLVAPPKGPPQESVSSRSTSTHVSDSDKEGEGESVVFEASPTALGVASSQPSSKHASATAPSLRRSDPALESLPVDCENVFSLNLVDPAVLALKSAFSDATAPPSASISGREGPSPAKPSPKECPNISNRRLLQSSDGSDLSSVPGAASPRAINATRSLSPLPGSPSTSDSPSERAEPESHSSDPAFASGLHASDSHHILLKLVSHDVAGYRSDPNGSKPGAQVGNHHNRELESASEDALSLEDDRRHPLLPTRMSEGHVPSILENRQESKLPPHTFADRHSATSDVRSGVLVEERSASNSKSAQRDSPLHQQSEHRDSQLDLQSEADDDLLLDLINVAAMPAAFTRYAMRQDSLFERTASWIRATMDVGEPLPAGHTSFEQDNVDKTQVANAARPEIATYDARTDIGSLDQVKTSSRLRDQVNKVASRECFSSSASEDQADPSDSNIQQAKRSLEGRLDKLEAVRDVTPVTISQAKVRSYSQRARQGQLTVKGTKRIPGRLKLPQHQPETLTLPRNRGSVELLSVRTSQDSSITRKPVSPQLGISRSNQGIDTEWSTSFNGTLRSRSRIDDVEPVHAISPKQGNYRVAQVVEDWDTSSGDDDDEIASVTVCKRMTLRRTSEFAVHSTPRRDTRLLPGRLQRDPVDPISLLASSPDQRPQLGELLQAGGEIVSSHALRPLPGKLQKAAVDVVSPQDPQPMPGRLQRAAVNTVTSPDPRPLPGKMRRAGVATAPSQALRPLPGKLSLAAVASEEPQGHVLPLRQSQGGQAIMPPDKTVARLQLSDGQQSERTLTSDPRRRDQVASHAPNPKERNSANSESRLDAVCRAAVLPTEAAEEPEEIMLERGIATLDSVQRRAQAGSAPTIRMQTSDSTPPRAQISSIRPLKLQGFSSTFKTPRQPNASVTNTSPLTVVSELWTPDASHAGRSTLTDATSPMTRTGLRPLLIARSRSGTRSSAAISADYVAARTRTAELSPRSQPRLLGGSHRHASEPETWMPHSATSQTTTPRMQSGMHQHQADLGATTNRDRFQTRAEHGSSAPRDNSGNGLPGFEISFELQEPKTAPHVQEDTLMEIGIRVLIKPSGSVQAADSWHVMPPSDCSFNVRCRTPERVERSVHPMQYEYNRLTSDEMGRVQQQAQDHLTRTLTSPDQRDRRPQVRSSSLLSPFSDPRERHPSLTDAGSSASSRQLLSPESQMRRQSGSPSTAASSVISIASASRGRRPSASLTSPIPYIKRALPRTASFSSVTAQS